MSFLHTIAAVDPVRPLPTAMAIRSDVSSGIVNLHRCPSVNSGRKEECINTIHTQKSVGGQMALEHKVPGLNPVGDRILFVTVQYMEPGIV